MKVWLGGLVIGSVLVAACANRSLPKPCTSNADCEADTTCVLAGQASYCFAASPVAVAPPLTKLIAGTTQQFTASLPGVASAQVTWSIEEGLDGGIIDTTGVYTAPLQSGTFHVQATPVIGGAAGVAEVDVTRPAPGSLDTTFADGGVLIFSPLPDAGCGPEQCAVSIAILDGGVIVVAGDSATEGYPSVVTVVELDPSGNFVPGFQRIGTNPGLTGKVVVDASGGLLISSSSFTNSVQENVERRSANGELDQQFGVGASIAGAGTVVAQTAPLVLLAGGDFLVGNTVYSDAGGGLPSAVEYGPTGNILFVAGGSGGDIAYDEQLVAVASGEGGTTVVALTVRSAGPNRFVSAAILSGATFDEGAVENTEPFTLPMPRIQDAAAVAGSGIVAVGSPAFISLLNLDAGAFDDAFDAATMSWLSGMDAGAVNGVAVGSNSDLIMTLDAPTSSSGSAPLTVARVTPSGVLDTAFGLDGVVSISGPQAQTGRAVALQVDGKIIVAGGAGSLWVVARIWP